MIATSARHSSARSKACADRLRKAGVDPAEFDVAETAADIEDLRRAVGVERWRLAGTYGTASRYCSGTSLLSRPAGAGLPRLAVAARTGQCDRRRLVIRLRCRPLPQCAVSTRCSAAYPDLERTWERALDRLAREPLRGRSRGSRCRRGGRRRNRGRAKLLRAARFASAGTAGEPRAAPRSSPRRRRPPAPLLGDIVATDPGWCYGDVPSWSWKRDFALGV